MDLSRKRNRERLEAKREPYWQRLVKGQYLGFRRGPDTWVARCRGRDGKQQYKALAGVDDFDKARRDAEVWFTQVATPAARSASRGTVQEALATYVSWLRDRGRDSTASEVEGRFRTTVSADPLARMRLEDLTREDFEDWRRRLKVGRQARSVNRQVRAVTAALNRVVEMGSTGNPLAWRVEPLADDVEEASDASVFLEHGQRAALIAAAPAAFGDFLRALAYTGARPGELAAATASDWDTTGGTLTLRHKKGRPVRLRARAVVVDRQARAFFDKLVESKLPQAPLLIAPGGKSWVRHTWAKAFRAAVQAVNTTARGKSRIPMEASAYSFRHARISELLQKHQVDPLTVAAQTGTGITMIEKNYYRFIPAAFITKLQEAATGE